MAFVPACAIADVEPGQAYLFDAHSIRGEVPRLFEGALPDLNLGTANGASCDPDLAERLYAVARAPTGFTSVLNGRFRGGYITRQYGCPADGVQAIQLELAQRGYMDEETLEYDEALAARLAETLRTMLIAYADAARKYEVNS